MDETTLSLHPPLRACWMKRGQQKRIPTPGTQRRHHVVGAYDWLADRIAWTTPAHKNTETFVAFLEHLLTVCYPSQPIVLVMDNASFHKSAPSLAALSLFEHRLRIVWLPPYCSTLNPIERFWRHLKDHVCVDKLFPTIDNLVTAVERELTSQNDCAYPSRFILSKNEP
jgi:transposase